MIKKAKDFVSKLIFEHQLKQHPFPCKIVAGASGDRYPGWLSTEQSFFDITNEAHWKKYFDVKVPVTTENQIGERKETIGGVEQTVKFYKEIPDHLIEHKRMQVISRLLAEHIFEHLTDLDAVKALKLTHKYLAPGGRIRIAVPDMNHPDKKYLDYQRSISGHKQEYNYQSLTAQCRKAGFKQFQLKEYFDAGGLFNISTWYRIDGHVKRSFWYDWRNMTMEGGVFWSSLIIDAIKER